MKQYQIVLHTGGNKYSHKGSTKYSYQIFAEDSDEAREKAIDQWEHTYGSLASKERDEMFDSASYRIIG